MLNFTIKKAMRFHLLICVAGILSALLFLTSCQSDTTPTAPDGFQLHPDFRLELVAAEPLVFDPVDMEFDENGRAYVLEMPGYPMSDAESRLVCLQDENGDGRFDARLVVADQLTVASSFMPYRGGFLVVAPPQLIWVKDNDGDLITDERTVIMDGFDVGNLQHNASGLSYGLDNWIYAANGGNDGAPYFDGAADEPIDLRGEDFRFRVGEKRLERVGESSGGFELAFDQWGNLFETHNLEHVSQLVFPGRYLEGVPVQPDHTLTVISDHEENGLSRIYPIGEQDTRVNHPEQSGFFSGACGITFYGGNAFPGAFNNNLFVADVVLNLIHLDVLSPDGAAFRASRLRDKVEFLASTDRSFRPVNMATGPDGALYVVDMYRDVIEHPEWIPDEIEATLDLNAGKDKGRIYRITPRQGWEPARPALDKNDPNTLVQALADPNQWTRLTAQRLIVESADPAFVPLLEELVRNSDGSLSLLHGLWALEGLGKLKNEDLLRAFQGEEAGLRYNALQIAEQQINQSPEFVEEVIKLTADADARVRLQAALTLSALSPEHYAAHEAAIGKALLAVVDHSGADRWTAMAVAAAAARQPVAFVESLLAAGEAPGEQQQAVIETLLRQVGKQHDGAQAQRILAALSSNQALPPTLTAGAVEALAAGWGEQTAAGAGQMVPALEKLEAGEHPAVVRACGQVRQALQLPASDVLRQQLAVALESVQNRSLPQEERLALLKLIELEAFDRRAPVLYALLDNREPQALQEEVLWQLWRADNPEIAHRLVGLWPTLGPAARKGAGDILLYKSANQEVLLSALESGAIKMGEMNFDLERRRTLLWWSDSESVKKRAEALFSDAGVVTRREAIDAMRPALELAGDVAHGQEVFANLCATCHRYGDLGQDVGPALTEINRKSKEALLYDILDPNAAVDTKYLNHQVRTANGSIYSGIVARETDEAVTLKMTGGLEQTIDKADIERFTSLGISYMPEGQEATLSQQDFADLLAFLQQPAS